MRKLSRRGSRPAVAAVLAAGLAFCVTACAAGSTPPSTPANQSGQTQWLTAGSAAAEYQATVQSITEPLPPGRAFPPGLPKNFIPKGVSAEKGLARDQAEFTWLCAWEDEYLAQFSKSSSSPALTRAERMITLWGKSSFYLDVEIDPGHGWIKNVVDSMKLGDPSGVQQDDDHMCAAYPTVTSQ